MADRNVSIIRMRPAEKVADEMARPRFSFRIEPDNSRARLAGTPMPMRMSQPITPRGR
jgi:hypothetical protein